MLSVKKSCFVEQNAHNKICVATTTNLHGSYTFGKILSRTKLFTQPKINQFNFRLGITVNEHDILVLCDGQDGRWMWEVCMYVRTHRRTNESSSKETKHGMHGTYYHTTYSNPDDKYSCCACRKWPTRCTTRYGPLRVPDTDRASTNPRRNTTPWR